MAEFATQPELYDTNAGNLCSLEVEIGESNSLNRRSLKPCPVADGNYQSKAMQIIALTPAEIVILDRQDPDKSADGGWQSLLGKLQSQVNRATGEIALDGTDRERIKKYAFSYGRGGWEDRLTSIFGRTLGPGLDANI